MHRVKQLSKHRYRIKLPNGIKEFTDDMYADWLRREAPCAICGVKICSAHHEPLLQQGSKQREFYWKRALALCGKHHIPYRHHGLMTDKEIEGLVYMAKFSYPRKYLEWLESYI